jgi:hypothetical protein
MSVASFRAVAQRQYRHAQCGGHPGAGAATFFVLGRLSPAYCPGWGPVRFGAYPAHVIIRLQLLHVRPFRTHAARGGCCGFWSGGELRKPRQCSFAFREPGLSWGIRTNGQRALAAARFSRSLLPTDAACHRLVHSGHAGGVACHRRFGCGAAVSPVAGANWSRPHITSRPRLLNFGGDRITSTRAIYEQSGVDEERICVIRTILTMTGRSMRLSVW